MPSITIDRRFCGPPNAGNGGYVCGLLAGNIGDSAEITLRRPLLLERRLDVVTGADGSTELRGGEKIVAIGRPTIVDLSEVHTATFSEAEDATRRTPYDATNHSWPTCFVLRAGTNAG